jgi:nucleotide-binding universal stress UspA family protein
VRRPVRDKGTFLLATDFSGPARAVFPYALKLASVLNLGLTILHVVKAPPGFEEWSPAARRSLDPLKTKALLELGRLTRLAKQRGVTADYRLLVGIPEDSILKVAKDAQVDLIAMGTHGRTGWDRLRLGSVAETILRKAPCPVLTVRASIAAHSPVNPLRLNLSRLLVAMDFSTSSEAALRSAVVLAKGLNAQVVLVHVSEPSGSSQLESVHTNESSESSRRRADQRFRKAISASRAEQVVSDRIMLQGKPIEVILDQAKRVKADLVVMGTHGRRGIKLLMLGSVAGSVVRRAGCPVLVVKPGGREWPEVSRGVRHAPRLR